MKLAIADRQLAMLPLDIGQPTGEAAAMLVAVGRSCATGVPAPRGWQDMPIRRAKSLVDRVLSANACHEGLRMVRDPLKPPGSMIRFSFDSTRSVSVTPAATPCWCRVWRPDPEVWSSLRVGLRRGGRCTHMGGERA